MNDVVRMLTTEYKNFVFLGEAGSGKTETALNLARLMALERGRSVHFFDLDQTKPVFRARDAADTLVRDGVTLHFQSQYLDAPTVAAGVIEALLDRGALVLLDVGGGSHGAHMIGQFSHILSGPDTRVIFLVNPYRPWSGTSENLAETVSRIKRATRLDNIHYAANPTLGPGTTAMDIDEGMRRINSLIPDDPPDFICVPEALAGAAEERVQAPVLPVRLNTLPEWLDGSGEPL